MIEIQIDASEAIKKIQACRDRIKNKTPLMAAIADEMHTAVIRNFEAEGRPRWRALAPATIKRRQQKGYAGKPILENAGTLKRRIESKSGNDFAMVGTNTPYAPIHQFGGIIKRKTKKQYSYRIGGKIKTGFRAREIRIPARPFLLLTDSDVQEIENLAVDYLENF